MTSTFIHFAIPCDIKPRVDNMTLHFPQIGFAVFSLNSLSEMLKGRFVLDASNSTTGCELFFVLCIPTFPFFPIWCIIGNKLFLDSTSTHCTPCSNPLRTKFASRSQTYDFVQLRLKEYDNDNQWWEVVPHRYNTTSTRFLCQVRNFYGWILLS